MFYIIKEGKNINSISDILDSSVYGEVSGDTEGVLAKVIDKNPTTRENLTRRIGRETNTIKTHMRQSVSKTLDSLSVSSDIHQTIPRPLLDTMIADLQDTSQTLLHGDPSGSHTARLLEKNVNV